MDIVTVGDIANKLNVDRDAVSYAVRKANIQPLGRAGIVRLFSGTAVETVKDFISSKRQSGREAATCST
jgi:hypothetical protein